jgi:hypothetical protein
VLTAPLTPFSQIRVPTHYVLAHVIQPSRVTHLDPPVH